MVSCSLAVQIVHPSLGLDVMFLPTLESLLLMTEPWDDTSQVWEDHVFWWDTEADHIPIGIALVDTIGC